jgi:Zn finger protein HypA/HybF involved in hydrogenase expression
MHEASVAQYTLEVLMETVNTDVRLKGKKVKKITFALGRPNTVMPSSFEFYFTELVKGTRFEGIPCEYEDSNEEGFFISSIDVDE